MASKRYTASETNNWWWVETDDETLCRVDNERTAQQIAAALNHSTDVAELAAALKPFAEFAGYGDDSEVLSLGGKSITVGDCRTAATVLSKLEGSET